ncbi:MAG: phage holin family protein [Candidatus Taylorbacteria bacterium]|nr:phage holin family protein [Candidatus Taylorbacteria bacterium]
MNILIHWLVSAIAIVITAYILPGVSVSGLGAALILAVVLGLINAILRPMLLLLTLPINVITLGLFTLIINALLVLLADSIVTGFNVEGFLPALIFAVILTFVRGILSSLVDGDKGDK